MAMTSTNATSSTASSYTPTAEMPLPGGATQIALWKALGESNALYELSLQLGIFGKSMQADPVLARHGIKIMPTSMALWRDSSNQWDMSILLHSMHLSMIRALILGTVAHDDFHNRLEYWPDPARPEGKVPGVYVIGLRRRGQDGKFLNASELRKLIKGLKYYIEGFRVLHRTSDPSQHTAEEKKAVEWVAEVDDQYSKAAAWAIKIAYPTSARFMEKLSDTRSIEALIESLRKRLPSDPNQDPDVRHIQSPIYVGCSRDLKTRMANYRKSQHFSSVNRPLSLTVSVLEAFGYHVDLSIHVAVRVWRASQLPAAEQLVVSLAQSLVYQTGFNSIPGGDNKGVSDGCSLGREVVLGNMNSPLVSNLMNTRVDARDRMQFRDNLSDCDSRLSIIAITAHEWQTTTDPEVKAFLSVSSRDTMDSVEATYAQHKQTAERANFAAQAAKVLLDIYKVGNPEFYVKIEELMQPGEFDEGEA